jgi:LemA protein
MIAALIVVGVALVAGVVWLLVTYNRLIKERNTVHKGLSQIDVQLKRRHDLIPNLVEAAKAYMAHERETLEAVIAARSAAVTTQAQSLGDASVAAVLTGTGAMAEVAGAEEALTGALGQFFGRAEAYPELKASENMMQLSEELTSTENRIAYARQAYNDAVLSYNTRREQVPTNLAAGLFSFSSAELWEAEFSGVRSVPEVGI